jgi:hypothetical protein
MLRSAGDGLLTSRALLGPRISYHSKTVYGLDQKTFLFSPLMDRALGHFRKRETDLAHGNSSSELASGPLSQSRSTGRPLTPPPTPATSCNDSSSGPGHLRLERGSGPPHLQAFDISHSLCNNNNLLLRTTTANSRAHPPLTQPLKPILLNNVRPGTRRRLCCSSSTLGTPSSLQSVSWCLGRTEPALCFPGPAILAAPSSRLTSEKQLG